MDENKPHFEFDPTEALHQFQAFFGEPGEEAVDPEEVRVTHLDITPLDEGRLLDVNLHLTPFRFRPHIVVTLYNAQGQEVTSADFIEPMLPHLSFTMHVPPPHQGRHTLKVEVLYPTPEHMPKTPAEQRISRGELKPLPPMRVVHHFEKTVEL